MFALVIYLREKAIAQKIDAIVIIGIILFLEKRAQFNLSCICFEKNQQALQIVFKREEM
jgi:hypothetical protein